MREIVFMPKAWQDLGLWAKNDVKVIKKIYNLLENTARTPFEGLGQPEALKSNFNGYWSRRINPEHRIVYKVEESRIVIISLFGHYKF